MEKLLIISFISLSLFFSCKENNRNTEKKNDIFNTEKKDTISKKKYTIIKKNELAGKTFYYLNGKNEKNYYYEYIPYGENRTYNYVFKKNMIVDGENIMEPTEWIINSIAKKDDYLRYIVHMNGNSKLIDTIGFKYNSINGILHLYYKNHINDKKETSVLINANKKNTVKRKIISFDDE